MKQSIYTLASCVLPLLTMSLVGCGKQEAAQAPKFDPKYIAAEADKGNLAPLTELNNACSAEVQKDGRRASVCAVQDQVRDLRKPMNIRF